MLFVSVALFNSYLRTQLYFIQSVHNSQCRDLGLISSGKHKMNRLYTWHYAVRLVVQV